jgi:hypothetical protein
METTYTIRAHDGQNYGPYSLANIQSWIAEGRIGHDTPMTRSDLTEWFPAGSFTELNFASSQQPATTPAPPIQAPAPVVTSSRPQGSLDDSALAAVKPGASWFYWIAGITAINAGSWLFDGDFRLALSFRIADEVAFAPSSTKAVGIAAYLLAIGLAVFCGRYASKGAVWAFAIGGVAYLGDAVLCLTLNSWIGAALHGWALFSIFGGLRNAIAIKNATR